MNTKLDYDFVVVGSGFGGCVSAHRLTEKGYSVAVFEMGKRYQQSDLPETTWNLKKFFWAPFVKMYGVMSISILKNLIVYHGVGVGGGSIVYANIHLEPVETFYTDPKWAKITNWKQELAPFFKKARKMLGTTETPRIFESDYALKAALEAKNMGHTFKKHPVGIYFGEPGETTTDPYFGGEGPDRTGCTFCGSCMIGCRVGAKNTLDKNYLYFAEKQGAQVYPETTVTTIQPIGDKDGNRGYEIFTEQSTTYFRKNRRRFTTKQVIISAGVLGTVKLLSASKIDGFLPNISDQLGNYVRTKSESIHGISVQGKDLGSGIAITSGGFADQNTHFELFRFGSNADVLSLLTTNLVSGEIYHANSTY